jgi:mRNA-degrading endonuclease toxin of MazEF toxin-antitoxin module
MASAHRFTCGVLNLCCVFTVAPANLRQFVGSVGPEKMREICRALDIAMACD